MFEILYNPLKAEKKPWDIFILAFAVTMAAIWLSPFFINSYLGVGSIILVTLTFFPLLFRAFNKEEDDDKAYRNEGDRFYHHRKIVELFLFIFLGALIAFFFSYNVVHPSIRPTLFDAQLATLKEASPFTASAISSEVALSNILRKNINLLMICIALSLVFGLGSLFLLLWNSSVLGIAMAVFVQQSTTTFGTSVTLSFVRYLTHGLPEMIAFFIASLGGAILSLAVLKHDLAGEKGKSILKDGVTLLGASVILLILSALIEVFITPYFF